MRDVKHARELLKLAHYDLEAMEVLNASGRIHTGIFGFHAQQAVEKSLKAWLSYLGVAYPFTHDLRALFALLAMQIGTESDRFASLSDLTPFAVQMRYEDFYEPEEELDRPAFIRQVTELIQHVEMLIR